ncbi:MAG TPA: PAS domain-containing protein, partial [Candidatus Obscuribacterales bacterium]
MASRKADMKLSNSEDTHLHVHEHLQDRLHDQLHDHPPTVATLSFESANETSYETAFNPSAYSAYKDSDGVRVRKQPLAQALGLPEIGRWSYDLRTGDVHWSFEVYALHELTTEFRPSYDRLLTFYTRESRQLLEAAVRSAIERAEAYDLKLELISAESKRHLQVRVTGHPVLEAGQVVGLRGSIQDISPDEATRKDQLVQELAETQRVYQLAMNASSAGIWHWINVNESESWWSNTFYELLGYLPGEIPSSRESFLDLLHPDDSDRTLDLLKAHFQSQVPFRLEHRLRTKSGRYKWFLGNGLAERDDSGRPLRMVGSIVDIDTEKRALEKLKCSESLLHKTSELANLGGWELNLETGQTVWSPEIYRMLELEPYHELHLEEMTRLVAYDCRARFQLALMEATHGKPCDLEFPIVSAKGQQRWIRFVIQPQPPRLMGFFQDITKRKLTEQQLIEALLRVENLEYAINSSSLVSVMDTNGYILHANARFCEVTGYGLEELLGKTFALFDSGYHDKAFYDEIWQQLRKGQPWHGEICSRDRDHAPFWVDCQIMPIYNVQGKIHQYFLIENLITERKSAEFKLLRLQEGLKSLNLITADIELDQHGKIQQALRVILEYLNMSFASISRIEDGNYELLHAYSRSPDFCAPKPQRYALQNSFCELVYRHRGMLQSHLLDPQLRLDHPCYRGLHFECMLGNLLEIRGLPFGTVTLFDFTPRNEAFSEQDLEFFALFTRWLSSLLERNQFIGALKKANAGKDQLLRIMAHDLRNPMSSILTRAMVLVEDLRQGESRYPLEDTLLEIQDISERALQLMESILEAKNLNLSPHPVMTMEIELSAWMRSLLEDYGPQADEHGIALSFAFPETALNFQLDPLMFRRVLDNLLSNAVKYTPAGGFIEAGYSVTDQGVEIFVSDTGIGIPKAQLHRLLSESWQLRREGLHGETSYGLGLAVVQDIVQLHHGRVSVSSDEGQGTRFTVTLPLES